MNVLSCADDKSSVLYQPSVQFDSIFFYDKRNNNSGTPMMSVLNFRQDTNYGTVGELVHTAAGPLEISSLTNHILNSKKHINSQTNNLTTEILSVQQPLETHTYTTDRHYSVKIAKRKRVTIPGTDGSKYSLTGKRIGRPKIDRGNTRCHECYATTTPQWRYLTEQELIYCRTQLLEDDDESRSEISLSSDNSRLKICLCNACWLRIHKAKQKHSDRNSVKKSCNRFKTNTLTPCSSMIHCSQCASENSKNINTLYSPEKIISDVSNSETKKLLYSCMHYDNNNSLNIFEQDLNSQTNITEQLHNIETNPELTDLDDFVFLNEEPPIRSTSLDSLFRRNEETYRLEV